jgi:MFS family permease
MSTWRQQLPPWFILILVGMGVALSLPGDTTLYIALPTHTAEAGIALADVGLMLSANRLIRLFINGPYGVLIERIPRRWMLVPSLLLGGMSYLLYTVPGYWPLLVGRLLWGIAWAGIWLGGGTVVLDIATDRNRGRYSGAYQIFFFSGVGGSAILAGILTDQIGYINGLQVSAAIALIMGFIWLVFLPETRPAQVSDVGESLHVSKHRSESDTRPARSRVPLFIAIGLLGINWLIFLGGIGAIMPLLLQERIGDEVIILGLLLPLTTLTGTMTAGSQFLSAAISPLSGWLTDRSGNRWGLVVVSSLLGVVSLLVIATGDGTTVILAILLSAIATSIIQTQVMTLVGDYAQNNRQGRILGILNTVGDLGSAGGPLLAYALLPIIGLQGIFWSMAGILALCLPLVGWVAWREIAGKTQPVSPQAPS